MADETLIFQESLYSRFMLYLIEATDFLIVINLNLSNNKYDGKNRRKESFDGRTIKVL
jgi:hypothetical protein